MSENILLKMSVKFAASLNIGKNLCYVLATPPAHSKDEGLPL